MEISHDPITWIIHLILIIIPLRVFWTWGYSTGWCYYSDEKSSLDVILTRWVQQYRYTAMIALAYLGFMIWVILTIEVL